jgi:fatty acid desaturase
VSASSSLPRFRDARGAALNGLAFAYALGGWGVGLWMITRDAWFVAAPGVLLLFHAMLIAAYLVHDACHDAIFQRHAHNRLAGELMSFVAGSSYAAYERIRHLHLRHHRERLDVSCFDYRAILRGAPRFVRGLVVALEWAYVPAVETIMHLQVIVRPFVVRDQRRYVPRVLVVLALRGALFAFVGPRAPHALALYLVAYALLLNGLAFFDAFQHTYECYFEPGATPPSRELRSRTYEQAHTFSNVVSVEYPLLNLLALNFGYHNAHHERTGAPWYRLPALHAELFPECPQVLPVRELFGSFHRHRVRRVFDEDYGDLGDGPGRADRFVGAHGVSLLSVV